MADAVVTVVNNRAVVQVAGAALITPLVAQAGVSAAAAAASADAAALSEAAAESLIGPTYANTAAGLAATAEGGSFAVDNGDGTVTIYRKTSGVAVEQRTLATTGALAADTGSSLVGFAQSGTGAVQRTVGARLLELPHTPEDYGAIGDGVADDTAALQAALDTGRSVSLTQGRTYLLKARLNVTGSNQAISGGGTVKIAADFDIDADSDGTGPVMRAFYVTGSNCSFSDITIDCTAFVIDPEDDTTGRSHASAWVAADGAIFRGVRFLNHPKGAAITGTQYGTWLNVSNCLFYDCTGAVFTQGRSPVIANNVAINCTDAAIALNGSVCVGATVTGNSISMEGNIEIPGMIAVEEGASMWTITGNTLIGCKGSGITCLNIDYTTEVIGGVIADNLVTGRKYDGTTIQTTTNPATLVYISEYYTGWVVRGNVVRDLPTGSSGSRCILVSATGGIVEGNMIDARNFSGATACEISGANGDGLTWRNNTIRLPATGRHVLFATGDYQSGQVSFVGGKFLGGSTGIDSDTNWASISNFAADILDISEWSGSPTLLAMTDYFGSRAAGLNGGGYAKPHRLGVFTDMYVSGSTFPTSAGAVPFQPGDTFQYLGVTGGSAPGVKYVPGGFKDMAALSA